MTGPRVSSAILKPRQWFPGTPKKGILAPVNPGRQLLFCEAQITSRSSEKESFLTSRSDLGRQEREDFPKPWTKSENIIVSIQNFARATTDSLHAMGHD
jgi:hypothetical protein